MRAPKNESAINIDGVSGMGAMDGAVRDLKKYGGNHAARLLADKDLK